MKLSISAVSLGFALVFGACSSQPPALVKGDDVAACTSATASGSGSGSSSGSASEKKKKKAADDEDDDGAGLALAGGSGYLGKLQGIIKDKCVSCHGSGGTEPELTSYETVLAAKKDVMAAVTDESMPKGSKLESAEKAAFFDWKKNEYAEGKAGTGDDDDDDAKKAPAKKKKAADDDDDDDAAKAGSGC